MHDTLEVEHAHAPGERNCAERWHLNRHSCTVLCVTIQYLIKKFFTKDILLNNNVSCEACASPCRTATREVRKRIRSGMRDLFSNYAMNTLNDNKQCVNTALVDRGYRPILSSLDFSTSDLPRRRDLACRSAGVFSLLGVMPFKQEQYTSATLSLRMPRT